MSDPRDFFEPAHKYLPEDVATDLALASTTYTWWTRLRRLFDADREEIARLKSENARLRDESDGEFIRAEIEDSRREKAQKSVSEWRRQYAELEGRTTERMFLIEALEAENRVVREMVEDALDFLWSANKRAYDAIYERCTWMMGKAQEKSLDTDDRDRLLTRISALTREYQDYMTIADHCTKVYDHFSGGRISKPFTLPFEVIAVAEEIQDADFEEWGKEHLEIALEPIRTRLQEFAQAWCEAIGGDGDPQELGNELMAWIEETFTETK